MNKGVMRIASLFMVVVMLISTMVISVAAATVDNVGALLDSYTKGSGTFVIAEDSRIYVVSDSAPSGDLLQTAQLIQREYRARYSGYEFKMVWGTEAYIWPGDIVLNLDAESGTGEDGYKLNVADAAKVTAQDTDGLIYGSNMLLKMLNTGTTLNGFTAADAPDTKERTVSLDCGRKYFTAEWIKNFIRQMSWMGYNAIELHFSDDGGFRLDIWDPAYNKGTFQVTNDFSWLCGGHPQYWVYDGYAAYADKNKYLTTEEIVSILEVAKEYHIEVIPSFDSPAHMDYLTWKFEQNVKQNAGYSFVYDDKTYTTSLDNCSINFTGTTGCTAPGSGYAAVDIREDTMGQAFVFAIYEDLADFFREYAGSTNFSIGADEVPSPDGRLWEYSDFIEYINDLNDILQEKNYTMRMFNDYIYNGGLDSSIEIMYWNSPFQPNTGNTGDDIIPVKDFYAPGCSGEENNRILYNCIQTNCYYVLRVVSSGNSCYAGMDARNPVNYNWTFYRSTEKDIYNEWYPADFSEKGLRNEEAAVVPEKHLGGAYFMIWNDYASLNTEKQIWEGAPDAQNSSIQYSLINRMWSNSIKMWNWDINNTVSYDSFAVVRNTFGFFPGYTSCSAQASLPDSSEPGIAYPVDHSALEAALANKIPDNGRYTAESYAVYKAAYAEAVRVHENFYATAGEIKEAADRLIKAKNSLILVPPVNNDPSVNVPTLSTSFTPVYLETLKKDAFVSNPFPDKIESTVWEAYKAAVNASDADAGSILCAENALVTSGTPKIISAGKISAAANGGYITLKVVTNGAASVVTVNLDGVYCLNRDIIAQGKLQQLNNGEIVKVWLVKVPVGGKVGTYDLQIQDAILSITINSDK